MRKIIFEQTGNIVLTIILTLAMTKTILESKYSSEPSNLIFEVKFGRFWSIFCVVGVLFSLAKYYYSKKNN